jgi:hypothetical protein
MRLVAGSTDATILRGAERYAAMRHNKGMKLTTARMEARR